jgi:hypothetical protein
LTTYRWLLKRDHRPERELFPGTSTLVLAAAGAVPPMSALTIAALAAGSLTVDWSLGLNGLTYDKLYQVSGVYRGMRMTARFSALVGAALTLLGAVGTARLLRRIRSPAARASATAALALIVLFDLRIDPRLESYPEGLPSIYSRVTSDMVLVELPLDRQADYMYFSTRHWARLVGGDSGYPRYTDALMDGWKAWPSPTAIDFFRKAGATHLTYNCGLEKHRPWRCAPALEVLDAHPGLEPLAAGKWEGKDARLYRIK